VSTRQQQCIERVYNPPLTLAVDLNPNHSYMFNPPPYVPSIHLSDLNPQFGHAQNMNLGTEMHRHTAELAERIARSAREDNDSDLESDDDYYQDRDERGRDYDYEDRRTRRDLPDEAVFFRREQEDLDELEIAHIERRVAEAARALEEARRDLNEAKMRIRDRRREERQRGRGGHSLPEFVRPSVDDGRATQQRMRELRDYLSPARNRSPPSTPQPQLPSLNLPPRSRSPSPYRFVSKLESEIATMASESVEPRSRSRSRTPNPTEEGSETVSASQEQVYQSFSKIHDLAKEFQRLKQNFVYPSVIDFQKPGSQVGEIITVRVRSPPDDDESDVAVDSEDWKLAYTRTNEGLHTYSHAMEKLLGKLDSVDSWNETSVRAKRRGVIGEIEQEASRLERYRQRVWRDYCSST